GNLASRTLSMIQRYRDGRIPALPDTRDGATRAKEDLGKAVCLQFPLSARENNFNGALDLLWDYLRGLDGYIVEKQPWVLAKDPAKAEELDAVLHLLWQALRMTAILVAPVMPGMAQDLWTQLGMSGQVADQRIDQDPWAAPVPERIGTVQPLFQRIDKEKEMSELMPPQATPAAEAKPALDVPELRETIDYDTFAKTDLRVGQVLEAERVPKSDKLIKMKVDLGFELRTIVGGIGKAYAPEDLVGRRVVVVANLAPRKLMGIESHGMLLAASDNAGLPYLVAVPEEARPGFLVK
ncbi:MAG TPA: methionine--tRNA ligase subunit beta, partial [Holophagaceae bacterium]